MPKAQEPTVLDEAEQALILDVIRRAEHIDLTEQERVGWVTSSWITQFLVSTSIMKRCFSFVDGLLIVLTI